MRTDLENLEKYLNFKNRFQGLEKALKMAKIKKILEKTLNFGVTNLTFVENKILTSSRETVCRKIFGEELGSKHERGGRRDTRERRRMRGWVEVDPRCASCAVLGCKTVDSADVDRATLEPASWPCGGYRRLRTYVKMTRMA